MDTQLSKPGPKTLNDKTGEKSGRLGGARADFIGSLGRKISDARNALLALERDPAAKGARDDVRRKLHALGTGARLLRFDGAAKALFAVEKVLDGIASGTAVGSAELDQIARVLDDLPALAWDDAVERDVRTPPPPSADGRRASTALVVGEDGIAMALSEVPESKDASTFECERTTDVTYAVSLAQETAPDVLVVDGDLPGASELVETLLDDPLTEPVPIVVLGRFESTEQESRYIALGVAKTLKKPASIDALQAACQEAVDQHRGRTIKVTLGEPTIEQLAERLAEEVRRGLCDALPEEERAARVSMGDGSDVLGVVKAAILRVQEVLAARSGGKVEYSPAVATGAATALDPNLDAESAGADRTPALRGRGAATDVRLEGRRVVVADDDPGVTWFVADLLRTTGCVVYEAFDGQSALELCYRVLPDLVVTDVVMPKLDGLTLARMIERDVALKDTKVVMLSWKEDVLQRAQELGAGAAAYLRKESDARAILARVREALWPRARFEARLRTRGEVRGRLHGISVRSLLEVVCSARRKARVAVRDASYLYEVEIREGAPCRAVRTSLTPEGSTCLRGARALAAMLGVSSGRFTVTPNEDAVEPELIGTLEAQLAEPLACARAAVRALSGGRIFNVESLTLDAELVAGYVQATPEPARSALESILRGASPRQMLLDEEVCPTLLERILVDMAARGAVREVRGADADGEDVLRSLVDEELRVLTPSAPLAAEEKSPSLEGAVLGEVSDESPSQPVKLSRGFILPELKLRPSLFSVITRSPVPAEVAAAAPATEEVEAKEEEEKIEAKAEEPTAEEPKEEKEEKEEESPPPVEAAPSIPTPSIPVHEAEPSEPRAKRRTIQLELETPKTPMTSVAVKTVTPVNAAKQRSERRWMGALALLGGIVVASSVGTRTMSKDRTSAAGAQVPATEQGTQEAELSAATVPVSTTPPANAAPAPVLSDVAPMTDSHTTRVTEPSAPARPSPAKMAKDAGASASTSTSTLGTSGLDVAAAAAVEYQSPRGLHRLP
jgi:DNA-binding response OmpR family regulator